MTASVIPTQLQQCGFVEFSLKLNLKVAGKKYGRFVALIQQALRELKPEEARAAIERGGFELAVDGERLEVTLDELIVEKRAQNRICICLFAPKRGIAFAAMSASSTALQTPDKNTIILLE